MNDPIIISFLFLLVGLLLGAVLTYLFTKMKIQQTHINKTILENEFVRKEIHQSLQQQSDIIREDLFEKEKQVLSLSENVASQQQQITFLNEKLLEQQTNIATLQQQARVEFENTSNRLLEEKSKQFVATNQKELKQLLTPLQEKIKAFEQNIDQKHLQETRDRSALKKEIELLKDLNQQLSQDANNLVSALKGDSKTQGDWGELQLEVLLEKAGLNKGVHFFTQNSYKDEKGTEKRPDFILNLPDNKQVIIDAKVSLTAYEKLHSATTPAESKQYLQAHIRSIQQHIKGLSSKNYQQLHQINSPDYILLFVPIESALVVAQQENPQIFIDALDKNIVLVSTSTLLATLRTIAYIWKQDNQAKNVLEIARQSGLLYDKFCAFVDDIRGIGQRLNQANTAYESALNKLSESKKFGDTLIGRAEKIKQLGAKTSKVLPKDLLE